MASKSILLVILLASVAWAGEVYYHATGLLITPPDGWTIRESKFTDLELIPPDPSSNDKGPTESYFLLTIGVAASSAQDPQLLEAVDSLMSQIAPFLKKTGEMEQLNSGGLQNWDGKSPAGQDVSAAVYVLPSKEVSFAQVSLGEKERILARQKALQDLYNSFKPAEGKRTASLVGNWTASAVAENQEKVESSMQFENDGIFLATQKAGEQRETVRGRWYAQPGKLFLVLENTPSMNLQFETAGEPGNRTLKLIRPNGDEEEMHESANETTSRGPD